MNFEFATAGRIVFGPGAAAQLPELVHGLGGKRVLAVTGSTPQRWSALLGSLETSGCAVSAFPVHGEPTTETVERGLALARQSGCDCVIALGGGSVIDTGKAVAALLTNPGEMLDYLEVVGAGKPLTHRAAPCVAVPTTAGTGAEVTRNSVLGVPGRGVKVSLRSPLLLPAVALVDPELTVGLPPAVTAATGLDALTQLFEAFVCRRANPFTDGFCREGLARVGRSLRRAYHDGANRAAREDMSLAALLGGLALANAGLGAVHGLAAPLGGMLGAPHGAVCGALLPAVIEANLRALESGLPGSARALERFREGLSLIGIERVSGPEEAAGIVRALCRELGQPGLADFGLKREMIDEVVQKGLKASSMKANPATLGASELAAVLERSFQPA
ncbi:iron-containing alcohol dehydrogenase [bacterium]|nr:iron-containing alcohol dehydrogenase [bacterium]